MSYGHCIVLPNQNRDTVQIILVQDNSTERIQSMGNYTAQQDFRWVPWVYMYNNTIGYVVMLVMCMIWKSTVYTIEIEINRAIYKSKPIKETSVNIPVVPLEFWLDPSI